MLRPAKAVRDVDALAKLQVRMSTQLAQKAEEESASSEPPRSPGSQHSERVESGIEESSGQESEPIVEPATIHVAVGKLVDHFIGELSSVIHGRTRSSGGVDSRAKNNSYIFLGHISAFQ